MRNYVLIKYANKGAPTKASESRKREKVTETKETEPNDLENEAVPCACLRLLRHLGYGNERTVHSSVVAFAETSLMSSTRKTQ